MAKDTLSVPRPSCSAALPIPPFDMYGIICSITAIPPGVVLIQCLHRHGECRRSVRVNIAPSGVGFGQMLLLYAVPLNKRFSVAGGLYASNFNWGHQLPQCRGITGIAAFKVNERQSVCPWQQIAHAETFTPLLSHVKFSPRPIGELLQV